MINPANHTFRLVQNLQGLAGADTLLAFSADQAPWTGEYSGPNVAAGRVILMLASSPTKATGQMLYHALSANGQLVAGAATTVVEQQSNGLKMTLNWRWIAGETGQGVSHWISD